MKKISKLNLAEIIVDISDVKLAEDFLGNMFTLSELEDLKSRLEVLKMVKDGMPHRKIAKDLKVSIATVSRGSKEVKYSDSEFIKLL